jgi:hypothetical protein
MPPVLAFRTLSLTVAICLASVPLTPAHVHRSPVNGRVHVVVHQHSDAEDLGRRTSRPDARSLLDHARDSVLTLSTLFIARVQQLAGAADLPANAGVQPPLAAARTALSRPAEEPVDAWLNPRPSPRGPPDIA